MIFKQGSSEKELFEGMQKAEDTADASEELYTDNLVLQAMQELDAAANIFEGAGRKIRAQEVTELMMALADGGEESDEDDAKDKKSKKSSKEEAKKVFMFFGFNPEDLQGLDFSSDGDSGDGE